MFSVNSELIFAQTLLVLFNCATYDGDVQRKTAIVIGGGIVGLATAFRLEQKFPDIDVTVLEKESSVGQHQTGHNSGVLHAGTYYEPGSEKSRLAVRGIQQMIEFCEQNDVRHEICGKLIVASDEDELPRLHDLFTRGRNNGLKGLEILTPEQMKEIEPHVAGVAALRVPQEGIVDYPGVAAALARKMRGRVVTSAKVLALRQTADRWLADTTAGDFQANLLINCAGLHCDRVGELAGVKRQVRILPF